MKRLSPACLVLLAGLCACGDSATAPSEPPPPSEPAPPPPGPEIEPLVSGTLAYSGSALVWTDYAYDDRGANLDAATGGDRTQSEFAGGDVAYPDEAAPGNAADLIQLQVSLDAGRVVLWAVLESLVNPDVPVLAVAFDTDLDRSTGAAMLPGGRWTPSGGLGVETMVSVSSSGACVWTWQDGAWSAGEPFTAFVDPETNVLGTTVPADRLAPGRAVWRAAAAVGIATSAGSWLDGAADVYDLAFVGGERFVRWQDNDQADVLAGVLDAATALAEVDFGRIADGETASTSASELPSGFHPFLYRSHLRLAEGVTRDDQGTPIFLGPYQPYLVYIPEGMPSPTPLSLFLHGSDQNHLGAVFQGPDQLYIGTGRALSDDPHLIATLGFAGDGFDFPPHMLQVYPLARGARLGYRGIAHQDVLDVLADAMRRFDVDPDRVILQGASMGGIGAFRLASLQPDRWSIAFPLIGFQTADLMPLSANLLNLPVRQLNGGKDPLIPQEPALASAARLDELGYDYHFWLLLDRGHEAGGYVWDCLYAGSVDYVRNTNPAHVLYVVDPSLDDIDPATGLELRFDSAYWVSGIRPRDAGALATVDATSHALPRRTETPMRIDRMLDNVSMGRDLCGPNPAVQTGDHWHEQAIEFVHGGALPIENEVRAELENVAAVTFDLARAGIDAAEPSGVFVSSHGAVRLTLRGVAPGARVGPINEEQTAGDDGTVTLDLPDGLNEVGVTPTS